MNKKYSKKTSFYIICIQLYNYAYIYICIQISKFESKNNNNFLDSEKKNILTILVKSNMNNLSIEENVEIKSSEGNFINNHTKQHQFYKSNSRFSKDLPARAY